MKRAQRIHYGTPNGPACGAKFYHDGLTVFGVVAYVSCYRCKRTKAYAEASR